MIPVYPRCLVLIHIVLWQLSKERGDGERYANVLYEKDGKLMARDINSYGPDVFVNYIIDFIKSNKDKPFFVYYPMVLAHDPFYPTPDSEEWKDKALREKSDTKHFSEMVTYMDKNVGKILDGISFYSQLSDQQTTVRDWSFCHYQDRDTPDYIRFVQTIDYKLYMDGRFYNKKKDINELNDIQSGTNEEEKLRVKLQDVLNQYSVWGNGILTTSGK